ncbi:response regulator [Brevundimonas sp.]|uniref:response regulator transcription factor n=1 Tax=Brevundimonas sp. TaxID=1871086 RepID=UPI002486FE30|nr:response regulator [Brevundimonas sp.]MDI1279886.1 response regulator [Brevundimonas sp.]
MPGRILIVDDDPFICDALELILTGAGHATKSLQGGQGVLESVMALAPDLVLMDVNMPGVGGMEALDTLRRSGITVPILMMTADSGPATIRDIGARGGSGHVTKPFDADALVIRIARMLEPDAAPVPQGPDVPGPR